MNTKFNDKASHASPAIIIEDDDDRTIVPGKRIVNRVGYYVTEKPWWNKYIVVNDAE